MASRGQRPWRASSARCGELVEGGFGKPEDFAAILKAAGWTAADIRHARWMAASVPEEHFEEFVRETVRLAHKGYRHRQRRALQTVLSKHGAG